MRLRQLQTGSALILFPAVVLVMLILGAICVDSASAYLAKRALLDEATAIADDAAARGLDRASFYATPPVLRIDPDRARSIAADRLVSEAHDGGIEITAARVEVSSDGRSVTVAAEGRARRVFAPITAGGRHVAVRGEATAHVQEVRVINKSRP
ncbi:MAG: hypothetical protein NVS3B21_06810 [Acidimicrobiales bacterium]